MECSRRSTSTTYEAVARPTADPTIRIGIVCVHQRFVGTAIAAPNAPNAAIPTIWGTGGLRIDTSSTEGPNVANPSTPAPPLRSRLLAAGHGVG